MQNEKAVFATKDNKGDGHFDMQKPMQSAPAQFVSRTWRSILICKKQCKMKNRQQQQQRHLLRNLLTIETESFHTWQIRKNKIIENNQKNNIKTKTKKKSKKKKPNKKKQTNKRSKQKKNKKII